MRSCLQGTAGIGKTALWLAGVDAANSRGYRLLSSRPSEAETGFSFWDSPTCSGLPPTSCRSCRRSSGVRSRPRAPARRVERRRGRPRSGRRVPRSAASARGRRSLCLAVDDVQWLDPASLAALRYALTRLDDAPVAILLAVRGEVPGLASPLRLRGDGANDRRRRPERRRDAPAAALPPRRDVLAADPAQAVGDLAGQSFFALELALRARGGAARSPPARSCRFPPTSTRSFTRASTASASGARGRTRGRGARRADNIARRDSRWKQFRDGTGRDARGADPRTGRRTPALHPSAARIRGRRPRHALRRRELHARLAEIARTAEECAPPGPRSVEPNDEIAAILEHEAGRHEPAARRRPPSSSPSKPFGSRRPPAQTTLAGAYSSQPSCSTEPGQRPSSRLARGGSGAAGRATSGRRSSLTWRGGGKPAGRRRPLPRGTRGGRGRRRAAGRHPAETRRPDALEAKRAWGSRQAGTVRAARRNRRRRARCRARAAFGLMQFRPDMTPTGRGDGRALALERRCTAAARQRS